MTEGCEWRHAPEACAEDLGDLRKVSKWSSSVRRRRLTFGGHRGLAAGAARGLGKVSKERWYLYPYVEKPLNSKVIKSFVPELRSRKCFCVSGFLCYLCVLWTLWTFCIPVWICLFHIFMYGYVTILSASRTSIYLFIYLFIYFYSFIYLFNFFFSFLSQ